VRQYNDEILLSADFEEDPLLPMRGHIDSFSLEEGLTGWALDLTDTDRAIELELLVGTSVIASSLNANYRKDLSEILGKEIKAGFSFKPEIFYQLKNYNEVHGNSKVRVRVAGTNFTLPSMEEHIILEFILKAIEPSETLQHFGFSLDVRLGNLMSAAHDFVSLPLRPNEKHLCGFVECIAADDQDDFIWFIGWVKKRLLVDYSAVIVDRQKIIAGMSFCYYSRDDLESGCFGIIGVLHTEWRPSSHSEPIIYFDHGKAHLRSVKPMQTTTKSELIKNFHEMNKQSNSYLAEPLIALSSSPSSWAVVEKTPQTIHCAVDKVLILPSFGIFVQGWIVGSIAKVKSFVARFGKITLDCDLSSMYFKPRPDLLNAFPGDFGSIARSGFCCICRGNIKVSDIKKPLLKVLFEDNSSLISPINPSVIFRLGHNATAEKILEFYPSVENESFFPAMVTTYKKVFRDAYTALTPHSVKICDKAIIVVVPEERHDCFLLFEHLRRSADRYLGKDVGLILIASIDHRHGELLNFFTSLAETRENPCSLFFLEKPEWAFFALPEIFILTHLQQFVFLAAGHFLTEFGWRNSFDKELFSDDAPTFLSVDDPSQAGLAPQLSSAAFAWYTKAFMGWIPTAPVIINDYVDVAYFPSKEAQPAVLKEAVNFSRKAITSHLMVAFNRQTIKAAE